MLSIVGTFVFGYIASQYAFPSIAVVMTFCMLCWSYNYCCKAFKITDEPLFSCFGGGGQDLGRTLSKERCFKNPFIHKHLGRSKRSCKVFLYWVTQHISQWLFCQTLVTHTLVFYFNHLAPITSLCLFLSISARDHWNFAGRCCGNSRIVFHGKSRNLITAQLYKSCT